jgi:bis(5'-nucleosyl)-tetraphosphatase (symmetrical)
MDFKAKGEVTDAPKGYLPWFAVPGRRSADHVLVTGHWSALGLRIEPNLLALDSGCLWGRHLTAVRLPKRKVFQVDCSGEDVT